MIKLFKVEIDKIAFSSDFGTRNRINRFFLANPLKAIFICHLANYTIVEMRRKGLHMQMNAKLITTQNMLFHLS